MKSKVVLVGAIPPPIGGVSAFIYRLAKRDGGAVISEIIDPYWSEGKYELPKKIHYSVVASCKGRAIWLFRKIKLLRRSIVHFNFSTHRSLFFLLFIPKRSENKYILTLHNGNLFCDSLIQRFLLKKSLMKMDLVVCLSSAQEDFYRNLSGDGICLKRLSSYVFDSGDVREMPDFYPEWKEKTSKFQHKAVASGYPTGIYNHDMLLRYFSANTETHFTLFLYGPDYENKLNDYLDFNSRDNISVFYNKSESEFNCVLKLCDLYLRPNSVDSFGIVTADAINFGLTVIASNVCERYPGTIVSSGESDFIEKLDGCLRKQPKIKISESDPKDSFGEYINIYNKYAYEHS